MELVSNTVGQASNNSVSLVVIYVYERFAVQRRANICAWTLIYRVKLQMSYILLLYLCREWSEVSPNVNWYRVNSKPGKDPNRHVMSGGNLLFDEAWSGSYWRSEG